MKQRWAIFVQLLLATSCSARGQTFDARDPRSPLQLLRTITLPNVHGRIDHMAIDPESDHLLVAELGSGTVDDVDLRSGTVAGRISGLHEPQGVAWLPARREIAVACGDGSVHFYRAADRQEVARISLGDDADDVRIDPRNGDLVVGYGSGALAIMDPIRHAVIREVKLSAHPEAFQIVGSRVFVNVPGSHAIDIADLDQGRVISTIRTGLFFGNFPMASDSSGQLISVAYRVPGTVSVIDARSGATISFTRTCGDADDLYFHSRQLVVICGSGAVDLIDDTPHDAGVRIITKRGARTGILDVTGDRLFVAVPAQEGAAAVWELSFRPPPGPKR